MSKQIRSAQSEKVEAFYNALTTALCTTYGENIHHGYWIDEHDQSSLQEAQNHLTDLVVTYLSLPPDALLLDAGCGTGAPALHIARTFAASITGITLSRTELDIALDRAREQQLSDRLMFQYADMTQMPFKSDSFDGAYAIESLCHVLDRADAIREIYRVLKPGGHFVFTDPFVKHTLPRQKSLEETFWHCSSTTPEYLTESLQAIGFTELKLLDLTNNVARTALLSQRRYAEFLKTTQKRAGETDGFRQTLETLVKHPVDQDALYFLIAAQKPSSGEAVKARFS